MATKKKAESGILSSVHNTAAGLHKAGLVDKATMREFDALCLTPVEPLAPAELRALREREQVSVERQGAGEHCFAGAAGDGEWFAR